MPSLDGLRTVSFGFVFAAHGGLSHVVPGAFGVTVFFFLSGFLITTLMRREEERTGGVSLKKFYLRRVLRILPPFYVVLALSTLVGLAGLLPGHVAATPVLATALHYSNYWIIGHGYEGLPSGTGVYWSLAVEEHFYLLFPMIFLGLVRLRLSRRNQALALLALCGLLLAWRLILANLEEPAFRHTELASDTRFDSILFGCALALFENPALDSSAIREGIWKRLLLPLGLLGLLASFFIRDEGFRQTYRYTLQGLSLVPVFVCAVRYPNWWPMRPLNWRPVAFVGVLSYSLYLMHQVVLSICYKNLVGVHQAVSTLLALGVTMLLAYVMYVVIEKPCAKLRRSLRV